jgi:hypothetical protein
MTSALPNTPLIPTRVITPKQQLQLAGWLVVRPENLPAVDISEFSWEISPGSVAEIVSADGYACIPPEIAGDVAEMLSGDVAETTETISLRLRNAYGDLRLLFSGASLLFVFVLLISAMAQR